MKVLENTSKLDLKDDWEFIEANEYMPRNLALIFFELRAREFGFSNFEVNNSLKSPRVYKCFLKLSESLRQWKKEGLNINIGDYFKALFDTFGRNTFPTHCLAECGLPLYFKRKVQNIKASPPLTVGERTSYRERRIQESMVNFSITREEVLVRFGTMLPDV